MTFWYAIREREGGRWLHEAEPDYSAGTFVTERRLARLWSLDEEREVREAALMLPIAVDVLSISDAP